MRRLDRLKELMSLFASILYSWTVHLSSISCFPSGLGLILNAYGSAILSAAFLSPSFSLRWCCYKGYANGSTGQVFLR